MRDIMNDEKAHYIYVRETEDDKEGHIIEVENAIDMEEDVTWKGEWLVIQNVYFHSHFLCDVSVLSESMLQDMAMNDE